MTQTATPPSTASPGADSNAARQSRLAPLRHLHRLRRGVPVLRRPLGDDGFLTGNNLLNIVRQTATDHRSSPSA